jgi:hypothetical protein
MADHTVRPHKNARNDLTAEYVRSILDYNPETGIFRWRFRADCPQRWNTRYALSVAGTTLHRGAIYIRINRINCYGHRLAWLVMIGEWPIADIDHIDGNPSNNSWHNLREASDSENLCNRGRTKKNTSGFKGVSYYSAHPEWNLKRWVARIRKDGTTHRLGYFTTPEEAHVAYDAAAKRLHGEFAKSE